MAIVLALRHFRVYLLAQGIPRIGRWWLEVQEYTFDIEYRIRSRMAHVDALSRNPVQIPLEVAQVDITEGDWILAA